jgi:hypothetical protein
MKHLLRNLCLAGLVAGAVGSAAPSSPTKLQGVLIDKMCSGKAESRVVPGGRIEGGMLAAYVHTRQCALMTECQRTGYGIVAYDSNKFLPFDKAGNQKALALLHQTKRPDDLRIEVTGVAQGDSFDVSSIRLLP